MSRGVSWGGGARPLALLSPGVAAGATPARSRDCAQLSALRPRHSTCQLLSWADASAGTCGGGAAGSDRANARWSALLSFSFRHQENLIGFASRWRCFQSRPGSVPGSAGVLFLAPGFVLPQQSSSSSGSRLSGESA